MTACMRSTYVPRQLSVVFGREEANVELELGHDVSLDTGVQLAPAKKLLVEVAVPLFVLGEEVIRAWLHLLQHLITHNNIGKKKSKIYSESDNYLYICDSPPQNTKNQFSYNVEWSRSATTCCIHAEIKSTLLIRLLLRAHTCISVCLQS